MTRNEAYALWFARANLDGEPPTPAQAFDAGWDAHIESLKQSHLPLGVGNDGESIDSRKTSIDCQAITPDQIWAIWPVKKARGAAIPSISRAIKKAGAATILQAVKDYAKAVSTWPPEERRFIPMCSTWMNQERWLDDRKEWVRGSAAITSQFSRS